jgi:hypothetical protein
VNKLNASRISATDSEISGADPNLNATFKQYVRNQNVEPNKFNYDDAISTICGSFADIYKNPIQYQNSYLTPLELSPTYTNMKNTRIVQSSIGT